MRLRRGVRRENDDASNARRRCVFVKASRATLKALTSLEEVRWTQEYHRFEEDVRNLELRAPREEAPARKTTSTRFEGRRRKSEGLQSFINRRTR